MNFKLDGNSPLFRWESGIRMTTPQLSPIIKEIVEVNNLSNMEYYAPYSFRIGGATEASIKKIPEALIFRFVGWSDKNLQKMTNFYSNFNEWQLSTFVGKMIHGSQSYSKQKNLNMDSALIFDPWTKFPKRKKSN